MEGSDHAAVSSTDNGNQTLYVQKNVNYVMKQLLQYVVVIQKQQQQQQRHSEIMNTPTTTTSREPDNDSSRLLLLSVLVQRIRQQYNTYYYTTSNTNDTNFTSFSYKEKDIIMYYDCYYQIISISYMKYMRPYILHNDTSSSDTNIMNNDSDNNFFIIQLLDIYEQFIKELLLEQDSNPSSYSISTYQQIALILRFVPLVLQDGLYIYYYHSNNNPKSKNNTQSKNNVLLLSSIFRMIRNLLVCTTTSMTATTTSNNDTESINDDTNYCDNNTKNHMMMKQTILDTIVPYSICLLLGYNDNNTNLYCNNNNISTSDMSHMDPQDNNNNSNSNQSSCNNNDDLFTSYLYNTIKNQNFFLYQCSQSIQRNSSHGTTNNKHENNGTDHDTISNNNSYDNDQSIFMSTSSSTTTTTTTIQFDQIMKLMNQDHDRRNLIFGRNNQKKNHDFEVLLLEVWEQMYNIVFYCKSTDACIDDGHNNHENSDTTTNTTLSYCQKQKQLQSQIILLLQYDNLFKCLHSYYFIPLTTKVEVPTSDNEQLEQQQQQQPKLRFGRFVYNNTSSGSRTSNNNTSVVTIFNYDTTIHRIHCMKSVIQIVLFIRNEQKTKQTSGLVSVHSIENFIFPMLYTLLNSTKEYEIQIGCILVYHILFYIQKDIVQNQHYQHYQHCLVPIFNNLNVIIQHMIKINRIGSSLWIIGSTQQILYQLQMGSYTDKIERNLNHESTTTATTNLQIIYKSLQEWFHVIDRNNRHHTQDHLIVGLLLGICPLLHDCSTLYMSITTGVTATTTTTNNKNIPLIPYGVEIGRLGLSALLPILNGDSGYDEIFYKKTHDDYGEERNGANDDEVTVLHLSATVQLVSLSALSNLIILSYPIIHRHCGKILCTLIAYVRRLVDLRGTYNTTSSIKSQIADNEKDITQWTSTAQLRESIRLRAIYVAAMIVVVGGKAADYVTSKIVSCGEYDSKLVEIVESIGSKAKLLTKK